MSPKETRLHKFALDTVSHLRLCMCRKLENFIVHWNISSDYVIISFSDVATTAVNLEPTKQNVVAIVG